MKIAIASNNEQTVAYHLGRAQGFVVVEIEDGQVKGKTYRLVSGVEPVGAGHQHRHGQGCCEEEGGHQHRHGRGEARGLAVVSTIQDCDAVIARGAGPGMVRNLSLAGKKLYLTELTSVDEAVAAYLKGEIQPAT
jgi:predicted Fe-Mo cluster-binding NifX family protein